MSSRLPQRSTRGKRLRAAVEEEEEAADEQFWNQEFFKEEAADDDYVSEKEVEDVPDSDFDLSEDDDDDGDENEQDDKPRKRSKLRPPGTMARPKAKPSARPAAKRKPPPPAAVDQEEADEKPLDPDAMDLDTLGDVSYEVPTLRRSTRDRVAEAAKERKRMEQAKPKRKKPVDAEQWRPLTQEELLAEAARTEVRNTESLQQLLAIEEETKRRAVVVKRRYEGPLVRSTSRRVDDHQQTTLEIHNTHEVPPWLRRKTAPPYPPQPMCAITGRPACYRDPLTGLPYATATAFRKIRSTRGLPTSPPRTSGGGEGGAGGQREGAGRGRGRGRRGRGGRGGGRGGEEGADGDDTLEVVGLLLADLQQRLSAAPMPF